jgi:hypothetical protein
MSFETARRVADTVLYEGNILYPYRASARKNRFRFQFGVLGPRTPVKVDGLESPTMAMEVPVEGIDPLTILGKLRFLQLCRRTVEKWDGSRFVATDALDVGGELLLQWDESVEREVDFTIESGQDRYFSFELPFDISEEFLYDNGGQCAGRIRRCIETLRGELRLASVRRGESLRKVHVGVENLTEWHGASSERDASLRHSLLGAHVLLEVENGAFVSLLEPPDHATTVVSECENVRAFPVLVGCRGDRSTVLGSPIILYDWPAIAPESQGDFFDATEIDEMLMLRTMTLTEEEKREARATDARAAALIARSDAVSAEEMSRLHGSVRSLGREDRSFKKGTRVRLCLGKRRTDAQDMFVDGRIGTVEEVRTDFEGGDWFGVTVDDDPATPVHRWFGRFLWFHADELEPLDSSS